MIDLRDKSDEQKAKIIEKHYSASVQKRRTWEPLWQILNKIFLPRRYDLLRQSRPGQQYGARVFDDHPAIAANKFALGQLAYTVSRAVPWLQFVTPDQRLMDDDSVKQYVQEAAEQVLWSFNESDFYGNSLWFSKDHTVTGTAMAIPEQDNDTGTMRYLVIPPGRVYIEDDQYGNPACCFYPFKMTAIQALQKFGKEKLPAKLVRNAEARDDTSNPFQEYEFLMAIYRNRYYVDDSPLPTDKRYKTYFLLRAERTEKAKLIQESGLDTILVSRMGKEPDQPYGISIAADALTSGLVVNKLGQKGLEAAHKSVEPPVFASGDLRSKIQLDAGGMTFGKEGSRLETIYDRLNWPIADAQMERIHAQLDERFFVHLFEMLASRDDLKNVTAYQISQMMGEKAVLIGAVNSFEQEFVAKAVDVQWDFETAAGRMPEIPDILRDPRYNKTGRIDVKFIGPLAQLQRSLLQGKGTISALEIIAQIGQIWPESLVKVNSMELIEAAAIAQGMEQKMFKTDDQVKEVLDQMEAERQQQEALQIAETAGKALPAAGKSIEPNSALSLLGIGNAA